MLRADPVIFIESAMRNNGTRYKVVSRMTAYEDQAEGSTLTTHAVLPGKVVISDASSSNQVVRSPSAGAMPLCVEVDEISALNGAEIL